MPAKKSNTSEESDSNKQDEENVIQDVGEVEAAEETNEEKSVFSVMKAESDIETNEPAPITDRIPRKRSPTHAVATKKGQKAQKTDVSESDFVSYEQAIQSILDMHPLITFFQDIVDMLHAKLAGMNSAHILMHELNGYLNILSHKSLQLQKFLQKSADL